jgi:hypothetical protein
MPSPANLGNFGGDPRSARRMLHTRHDQQNQHFFEAQRTQTRLSYKLARLSYKLARLGNALAT